MIASLKTIFLSGKFLLGVKKKKQENICYVKERTVCGVEERKQNKNVIIRQAFYLSFLHFFQSQKGGWSGISFLIKMFVAFDAYLLWTTTTTTMQHVKISIISDYVFY